MVAAGEDDDAAAPGEGARGGQRVQVGLGAGVAEAEAVEAEAGAQQRGVARLVDGGGAEVEAVGGEG